MNQRRAAANQPVIVKPLISSQSHYISDCSILHDRETSEIKRRVVKKNSVRFHEVPGGLPGRCAPHRKSAKGKEIIVTDYRDKMEGPLTAFKEEKVTPRSALTLLLSV